MVIICASSRLPVFLLRRQLPLLGHLPSPPRGGTSRLRPRPSTAGLQGPRRLVESKPFFLRTEPLPSCPPRPDLSPALQNTPSAGGRRLYVHVAARPRVRVSDVNFMQSCPVPSSGLGPFRGRVGGPLRWLRVPPSCAHTAWWLPGHTDAARKATPVTSVAPALVPWSPARPSGLPSGSRPALPQAGAHTQLRLPGVSVAPTAP